MDRIDEKVMQNRRTLCTVGHVHGANHKGTGYHYLGINVRIG